MTWCNFHVHFKLQQFCATASVRSFDPSLALSSADIRYILYCSNLSEKKVLQNVNGLRE